MQNFHLLQRMTGREREYIYKGSSYPEGVDAQAATDNAEQFREHSANRYRRMTGIHRPERAALRELPECVRTSKTDLLHRLEHSYSLNGKEESGVSPRSSGCRGGGA